jgi:hypothetical protein
MCGAHVATGGRGDRKRRESSTAYLTPNLKFPVVISQMLLTPQGLISQLEKKSRSRLLAERLSGELFGLTFGL